MSSSLKLIVKTGAIAFALAYCVFLGQCEARNLMPEALVRGVELPNGQQLESLGLARRAVELDARATDSDDDDEEDDRLEEDIMRDQQVALLGSTPMQPSVQYENQIVQPRTSAATSEALIARSPSDLKTAASYHHKGHGKGAKGWLEMGAWTGKKGAFGWHDKHPVGKGK